jgi:hypothetical protein
MHAVSGTELDRLCAALRTVAALMIGNPVYTPIFERLEQEIEIDSAGHPHHQIHICILIQRDGFPLFRVNPSLCPTFESLCWLSSCDDGQAISLWWPFQGTVKSNWLVYTDVPDQIGQMLAGSVLSAAMQRDLEIIEKAKTGITHWFQPAGVQVCLCEMHRQKTDVVSGQYHQHGAFHV